MNINFPASIINPAYTIRTKWAVSKSDGLCLEIGCNVGRMTTLLAKNHHVAAGDVNPEFCKKAKRTSMHYRDRIEFVVFDASNSPFRDDSFDTVLMIDVLEHLEDPVSALKEAKRVGRRKILLNVPNYDFAHTLYPNMLPEHFKEPTHLQQTNIKMLKNWLCTIRFTKVNILGSYFPLPLPLIPISYVLESLSKRLHISPKRIHFQISCEIFL
jgi:ubiquinone/menaquinone biosynthesis C-methylase UbiE